MSRYQRIKERAMQYSEEHHTEKTVIMTVVAAMNAKLNYNVLAEGEGKIC